MRSLLLPLKQLSQQRLHAIQLSLQPSDLLLLSNQLLRQAAQGCGLAGWFCSTELQQLQPNIRARAFLQHTHNRQQRKVTRKGWHNHMRTAITLN
jgi:hypothetical protein